MSLSLKPSLKILFKIEIFTQLLAKMLTSSAPPLLDFLYKLGTMDILDTICFLVCFLSVLLQSACVLQVLNKH